MSSSPAGTVLGMPSSAEPTPTLFEMPAPPSSSQAVNVASVPQRSPFRYPGGKTWLVPQARRWLEHQVKRPALLVEPFAGGGSIALLAAAENRVEHVVMGELDPVIACVWQEIIHGDAEALAVRIEKYVLTEANVHATLAQVPTSNLDRAFLTILRNRVNRGGILAPGAGLIKKGENGRGLSSRWYPETLARRIRDISAYRDRITFVEGDAFALLEVHRENPDAVLFVDPPYTAGGKNAGSRLYATSGLDHQKLFMVCAAARGDALLTYDNAPEVVALAQESGLDHRPVAMKSSHHAQMKELLIGRDLTWVN